MSRYAIDTGPIVALLNKRDTHHDWARNVLDGIAPPIFTCESVISEACYVLSDVKGGSDAVLNLVARGIVAVNFQLSSEISSIRRLMAKYSNVPMTLADGCLVRMSELDAKISIITLDSDFGIYRKNGRQVISLVAP